MIQDGIYDEEEGAYTFTNDGYDYVVGYHEDKPLSEGGFERHEFMLVRKNGKVVLKEERESPYDE